MSKFKKFHLIKADYLSTKNKPKFYIQLNVGKPLHVVNFKVNKEIAPNTNYKHGSLSKETPNFPKITNSNTPVYWQETKSQSFPQKTERGREETERRPSPPPPSPPQNPQNPQTLNQDVPNTPQTNTAASNTSFTGVDANTSTSTLDANQPVSTNNASTNTSFANPNTNTLPSSVSTSQTIAQDASMASESNNDASNRTNELDPKLVEYITRLEQDVYNTNKKLQNIEEQGLDRQQMQYIDEMEKRLKHQNDRIQMLEDAKLNKELPNASVLINTLAQRVFNLIRSDETMDTVPDENIKDSILKEIDKEKSPIKNAIVQPTLSSPVFEPSSADTVFDAQNKPHSTSIPQAESNISPDTFTTVLAAQDRPHSTSINNTENTLTSQNATPAQQANILRAIRTNRINSHSTPQKKREDFPITNLSLDESLIKHKLTPPSIKIDTSMDSSADNVSEQNVNRNLQSELEGNANEESMDTNSVETLQKTPRGPAWFVSIPDGGKYPLTPQQAPQPSISQPVSIHSASTLPVSQLQNTTQQEQQHTQPASSLQTTLPTNIQSQTTLPANIQSQTTLPANIQSQTTLPANIQSQSTIPVTPSQNESIRDATTIANTTAIPNFNATAYRSQTPLNTSIQENEAIPIPINVSPEQPIPSSARPLTSFLRAPKLQLTQQSNDSTFAPENAPHSTQIENSHSTTLTPSEKTDSTLVVSNDSSNTSRKSPPQPPPGAGAVKVDLKNVEKNIADKVFDQLEEKLATQKRKRKKTDVSLLRAEDKKKTKIQQNVNAAVKKNGKNQSFIEKNIQDLNKFANIKIKKK